MLNQPIEAQLAPYALRRDLQDSAAISCYLGGIESSLHRQRIDADETDLFLLGGAYRLHFQVDEYGEPDLWFPFTQTLSAVAIALGCSLQAIEVDFDRLVPQLCDLLRDGHGVMAWVFSRHLDYTSDPYAQRGYVHSVLVDSVDPLRGVVTVTDRFLATVPPSGCIAELDLEAFRRALLDAREAGTYPGVGSYHVMRSAAPHRVTPAQRRDALATTAVAILADDEGTGAIRAFADAAWRWFERSSGHALVERIESSNRVITTDHVLPSRRALRQSILGAGLDAEACARLLGRLDEAIGAWQAVAYRMRKATRRGPIPHAQWQHHFDRICEAEGALWRDLAGELAPHQPDPAAAQVRPRLAMPEAVPLARDLRSDPETAQSQLDCARWQSVMQDEIDRFRGVEIAGDDDLFGYAESRIHALPAPLRDRLNRFKRTGGRLGFELLSGLLPDVELPAGPAHQGRVQDGGAHEVEFVMAMVAMLLGDPFGHRAQSGGTLIHDCRPSAEYASMASFGDNSVVPIQLHTDGAAHPLHPDFVVLHCLRAAQDARTVVVPLQPTLEALDPATLALLHEPRFVFRPDPEYGRAVNIDPREWSTKPTPILTRCPDGRSTVRFDYDLVSALDPQAEDALGRLDRAMWQSAYWVSLRPGEMLVLDQRHCLHGRTPFAASFTPQRRWLKICFVARDLYCPRPAIELRGRLVDNVSWDL